VSPGATIVALLHEGTWGIAAQVLTLSASLLPIVFGRSDQLVIVVSSSAIATSCVPLFTLASQFRVPSMTSVDEAFRATAAGILTAVIGSLVLLALVAYSYSLGGIASPWDLAVATALLALSQSVFMLALSALTWRLAARPVLIVRLAYGISLFAGTLPAAALDWPAITYLHITTVAMALASTLALVAGRVTRSRLRTLLATLSGRDLIREYRALPQALTTFVGSLGAQIASIATPSLGGLAGAWAIAMRLQGGFLTLGSQTIGSMVDVRIARAVRRADSAAAAAAVRRARDVGTLLGFVYLAAAFVAVAFTSINGRLTVGN